MESWFDQDQESDGFELSSYCHCQLIAPAVVWKLLVEALEALEARSISRGEWAPEGRKDRAPPLEL